MNTPDALRPIPGDAESVFDAGARFTILAASLEEARNTLSTKAGAAVDALDGPRAERFAEAAGTVNTRLEATATQLDIAALALNNYGTVLAAAQAAIDDLAAEWEDKQQLVADARGSDDPDAVADARSRQSTLEADGDTARSELGTAAERAASTLDEATDILIPGAGGMTPAAILEESLGSWAGIVLDGRSPGDFYTTFKEWSDPALAAKSLVGGASQLGVAASIVRNWNEPHRAQQLLRQAENLEKAKLTAVWRVTGDAGDFRYLQQLSWSSDVIDQARRGAEAADAAMASRVSRLSQAAMLTSKFAKFTGVLGIASGVYDVFKPPHSGWRGGLDQLAGAAAAGGGAALILATAGLVPAVGVIAPAAVAALAVAGAWTVGNLIYDHWPSINSALDDANDWVEDRKVEALVGVSGWTTDRWNDFEESNWNPGNWF
ncbi:hypothetical protein CLV30_101295 [Haloactinopolyspora alba]|uniref:Uncharacterized protein n=1 Tax=Haloactinopolyspora alba TaxID=648780 RepID=A0A2P8EFV8_9ACTN|nr:hypothetical protein [Haloactinopolyspora alba]PSL08324.1 hypothetical protein CLV30_101295 [Haloactinopolyspora alba]